MYKIKKTLYVILKSTSKFHMPTELKIKWV